MQFYLKNIIIQNFATFKNQSISFRPGFNVIVGETGSGKSLVLDALQLILGGRADKKIVRRETEYSLIEATFHCCDPVIKKFMETEGYPLDQELVIKRLIYKNGSSKNYLNHLSCTVAFLALFAKRYIDVVGQFENQKLLSESYQLQLLDHFAQLKPDLAAYQLSLQEMKQLIHSQNQLIHSKDQREQRLDYLNYQLQEIEKLNPSSQDEENLLQKKNSMLNVEKTQKTCHLIKEVLEGFEAQSGLLAQIRMVSSVMSKNQDIFAEGIDMVSAIEDQLHHVDHLIEKKMNFEFDPSEMEPLLDRLDCYQKLKKKFGGTTEGILQARVDFMKEKSSLDSLEYNLEGIGAKIKEFHLELLEMAEKLHQQRQQYSQILSQELTARISHLRMNGASIKVMVEKTDDFNDYGQTRAFFMAETNRGEGFFKIKDIASGGELSRILLAVRQILSQYDSISIFLFDEIDTGIGGETANYIGKALAEVAVSGQVIAITHLPQIARFAELLVMVHKDISNDKTQTRTESYTREISGKMIMKEVKMMAHLQ